MRLPLTLLIALSSAPAAMATQAVPAGQAAQAPAPAAASALPPIVDVAPVLVSGRHAGPGLWQVRKGDNVLWLLGTVSPMPRGLDWHSPQAEALAANADEVINAPGVYVGVGLGGMFKAAFAMPTIFRARRLPDDQTLRDALPPDLHARWVALKARYLPRNDKVESWRPLFAAMELYSAALEQARLDGGHLVGKRLHEIVEDHDVRTTSTAITGTVKDPRGTAKAFARSALDDVACFRGALDQLEADVALAAERANAWAVGDIAEMRRLQGRREGRACADAVFKSETARMIGVADGHARSRDKWLQAAESALARNDTTFGTLPMGEMLDADGLLAQLQARGYEVVAPE